MLLFCFVVNTFSAKTVCLSGGFIIACSLHFHKCHGFFHFIFLLLVAFPSFLVAINYLTVIMSPKVTSLLLVWRTSTFILFQV